jgi:hypothetical protein
LIDQPSWLFDINRFLFKGIEIRGWYLSHYIGRLGFANLFGVLEQILQHLAKKELVFSAKTFDMENAYAQALFHCKLGSKGGKAVLTNPE